MALAWEDLSDVARKPHLIKQHASDRLWQIFGSLAAAHAHDQPFVIAQLGQSLDGRIATPSGHSHYINGDGALDHLHCLRALVDAVIVGASTVALDNPSLTVRRVTGPNPARVIIDPNRRVQMGSQVFVDDGAPVFLIGPARPNDPSHLQLVPADNAGAYPAAWMLKQLGKAGLRRVLVEGGATTVSRFVSEKALNRLHILVGPLIIGSGSPGLSLPEIGTLADAIRPVTRVFPFDSGDVLFDCAMERDVGSQP